MDKFVVAPHFRLHEWVAEEKGYFAAEGLDYEFRETMDSQASQGHHIGNKVGAYQTFEKGRECNVSGACHWTVNVAASNGHGKLYSECYSVSPAGVFVPVPGAPAHWTVAGGAVLFAPAWEVDEDNELFSAYPAFA